MGVTGELLTIYAALPYVQKTGLYSVTLPNKYNFSFDYYTFLIIIMMSYIPRKSSHLQYFLTFSFCTMKPFYLKPQTDLRKIQKKKLFWISTFIVFNVCQCPNG